MSRIRPLLIAATVALALPGAALAHPPTSGRPAPRVERPWDPQHEARREVRAGNVVRLHDIERRIVPTMPGMQYLGPEYDAEAMAYRLKFIRNGRVEFVDVDARTGLVRGRSF
jgi:hypothetical protein